MSLLWWTANWNWELRQSFSFSELHWVLMFHHSKRNETRKASLVLVLSVSLATCPSLVSLNRDIPLSPELFLSVPQTDQPNGSSPSLGCSFHVNLGVSSWIFNTNDHRGCLREVVTQARVMTIEGGNWTNLSLNLFLFISLITNFRHSIAGPSRQQELKTAGHVSRIVWNRQTWMHACLLNYLCSALYTLYMWYCVKFWWMVQFECDICSLIGPEIHSLTPLDPIIMYVLSM